jgi:L-aspartate oxidase
MVFGARAVEAVLAGKEGPAATGALRPVLHPDILEPGEIGAAWLPRPGRAPGAEPIDDAKGREVLQRAMTRGAGVVRSAGSLSAAVSEVNQLAPGPGELANLIVVARALIAAATAREESRGGHRREDFPARSEFFSHRFVL